MGHPHNHTKKNEFLHYDTRILHETLLILTHIRAKTSKNKVKTTKKTGKIGKIRLTLATIQKKAGEFLHIAKIPSKNRINFKCKTLNPHQKHAKPHEYPPPTPHDDHYGEHSPQLTYLFSGKSTLTPQTFERQLFLNTSYPWGGGFYAFFCEYYGVEMFFR